MSRQHTKEVTPTGRVRTPAHSSHKRGKPSDSDWNPDHDFNAVKAKGLHLEALLGQITSEELEGAERQSGLDELESRLGWQRASDVLMAHGPSGGSIAQGRWGDWMQPASPVVAGPLQLKSKGNTLVEVKTDPRSGRRERVRARNEPGARRDADEVLKEASSTLPHLDAIQASFGAFDVSQVSSAQGERARSTAAKLGAEAFASAEAVAFSRQPDLFTAAHEAAHVVQQRGGVTLQGGMGESGDRHEQHADAVAHRVVRGLPAQDLLQAYARPGPVATPMESEALQLMVAQISVDPSAPTLITRLNVVGRPPNTYGSSMGDHSTAFVVQVANVRRRLEGQRLDAALLNMDTLIAETQQLPGYALVKELPGPQQDRFLAAWHHMTNLRAQLPSAPVLRGQVQPLAPVDWSAVSLAMQDLVAAYLEARELVPLSTTNVKAVSPATAGKGKGESGPARVLAAHQGGDAQSQGALRQAFLGVFDTTSAALVAAEVLPWNLERLSPGMKIDVAPMARLRMMAEQHVRAVQSAYPVAFAAAYDTVDAARDAVVAASSLKVLAEWKRALLQASHDIDRNLRWIVEQEQAKVVTQGKVAKGKLDKQIERFRAENVLLAKLTERLKALLIEHMPKSLTFDKIPVGALGVDGVSKQTPNKSTKKPSKSSSKGSEEEETSEEQSAEEEERNSPLASQIHLREGRILTLDMAGRTASPLPGNSMGAHTTAWVVHLDRTRQALIGLTPAGAIAAIESVLMPEAMGAVRALAAHFPPEGQHQKLLKAQLERVGRLIAAAKSAAPAAQPLLLQSLIGEYLTFVNFVPGATLDSSDTSGHGEGTLRGVLRRFEEQGVDPGVKALKAAIAGLFDVDVVDDPDAIVALWDHHLQVIGKAYPKALKASGVPLKLGKSPSETLAKLKPKQTKESGKKKNTAKKRVHEEPHALEGVDLIADDGAILNAAEDRFVAAYRQDISVSNQYLNEGDGHIIAQRLGITVNVYRGAVPPGFVGRDMGAGGHCLIHSLTAARAVVDTGVARGATADEILGHRQAVALALPRDNILAACAAAVYAQLTGGAEFGLGPSMRGLLGAPSIQKVKHTFGSESSSSSKSSTTKSSTTKSSSSKKDGDGGGGGLMLSLGGGVPQANVAILHTGGAHYVLLVRVPSGPSGSGSGSSGSSSSSGSPKPMKMDESI